MEANVDTGNNPQVNGEKMGAGIPTLNQESKNTVFTPKKESSFVKEWKKECTDFLNLEARARPHPLVEKEY